MKYKEWEGNWGFYTRLVTYGWVAKAKKYTIILSVPGHNHFSIYNSGKKPWIRNVNFLSVIWSPFLAVLYTIMLIVSIIYLLFFEFHHLGLIDPTTDSLTKISGWISIIISIIGVIAMILYFTSHLRFV